MQWKYSKRVDRVYVGTHFEDFHVDYQSNGRFLDRTRIDERSSPTNWKAAVIWARDSLSMAEHLGTDDD